MSEYAFISVVDIVSLSGAGEHNVIVLIGGNDQTCFGIIGKQILYGGVDICRRLLV